MNSFPPPSDPLSVFPAFTSQRREKLTMKIQLFPMGYDVKNQDGGRSLIIVREHFFSNRKDIYDANQKLLFTIRKQEPHGVFTSRKATHYTGEAPRRPARQLFKFSFPGKKSHDNIRFFNLVNGQSLELLGTMEMGHIILRNNANRMPLVDMFERAEAFSMLKYYLEVAPGVDTALMVAFCLCWIDMVNYYP
jgi:hypothetical protein